MTPTELHAKLAALAEKVTPGEWVASDENSAFVWRIETDAGGYPNDGWVVSSELLGPDAEHNAEFIALARNNLPTILQSLAELGALREALATVRSILLPEQRRYLDGAVRQALGDAA